MSIDFRLPWRSRLRLRSHELETVLGLGEPSSIGVLDTHAPPDETEPPPPAADVSPESPAITGLGADSVSNPLAQLSRALAPAEPIEVIPAPLSPRWDQQPCSSEADPAEENWADRLFTPAKLQPPPSGEPPVAAQLQPPPPPAALQPADSGPSLVGVTAQDTAPVSIAEPVQAEAGNAKRSGLASAAEISARHAVLLVEGDPLHSLILARRLQAGGYSVDLSDSAPGAVAAFRRSPFGVVLIDCDTPEIDGYAAAVACRLLEDKTDRTTLIAVTSETSSQARAKRKAAGFDNYLEKPVSPEKLNVLLGRYSPTHITSGANKFVDIDRAAIARLCTLRTGGGAFLRDLVSIFLVQAQRLLSQMRLASEDDNADLLGRQSRALKGLAREVGASRMHDLCVTIHTLASSHSMPEVPQYLAELSLAMERVSSQLREAEIDLLSSGEIDVSLNDGSARPQRTGRVLVAESNPLVARFLLSALSSAGLEVFYAQTGREALATFRERAVDAAVVDASLPDGDGYFVLTELRLDPKLVKLPVLILSERGHEQDVLRAFELGADDYVPTPFNPQEVSARVRNLLRKA